jgi:hypothetical protein
MLTEKPGDESFAKLLSVVLKVAQMHGSSVALSDLVQLLPSDVGTKDIVDAFEILPALSGNYSLKDGLLVPRAGSQSPPDDFLRRVQDSASNISVARWLSQALGSGQALTIAVSGSTSYKAASPRDDLDLFCVTRPHTMWLFLAKALLLTRASRILRRSRVPICLSCVVDEEYAKEIFSKEGGALFARDALVAEVVLGDDQYAALLDSAFWMKRYFPKLYEKRRAPASPPVDQRKKASGWARSFNLLVFATVGSYIRAKAIFHNRVLAMQGKEMSGFRARAGPDHLIYESAKYKKLKAIYDGIRPMPKEFNGNSDIENLSPLISGDNESR